MPNEPTIGTAIATGPLVTDGKDALNTPVRAVSAASTYSDKLIKLIPSEIVGAFITVQNLCKANGSSDAYQQWSALILLLLIPFYLYVVFHIKNWIQTVVTMISFGVWVYSIGGDHVLPYWYNPVLSGILLVFWTLIVPLIPNSSFSST